MDRITMKNIKHIKLHDMYRLDTHQIQQRFISVVYKDDDNIQRVKQYPMDCIPKTALKWINKHSNKPIMIDNGEIFNRSIYRTWKYSKDK